MDDQTKIALCKACTLATVMKDCKSCSFNIGLKIQENLHEVKMPKSQFVQDTLKQVAEYFKTRPLNKESVYERYTDDDGLFLLIDDIATALYDDGGNEWGEDYEPLNQRVFDDCTNDAINLAEQTIKIL